MLGSTLPDASKLCAASGLRVFALAVNKSGDTVERWSTDLSGQSL